MKYVNIAESQQKGIDPFREPTVMELLNWPSIVKIKESFPIGGYLYIVMEHVKGIYHIPFLGYLPHYLGFSPYLSI